MQVIIALDLSAVLAYNPVTLWGLDDQLEKLKPFLGEVLDSFNSYFIAT